MGDLRPLADVLARVLPALLDVDRGEHVWRVERQPPERRNRHHPAVPSRDDTRSAQHDPGSVGDRDAAATANGSHHDRLEELA